MLTSAWAGKVLASGGRIFAPVWRKLALTPGPLPPGEGAAQHLPATIQTSTGGARPPPPVVSRSAPLRRRTTYVLEQSPASRAHDAFMTTKPPSPPAFGIFLAVI